MVTDRKIISDLNGKNIKIRLDVYERLLDMKRGNDTFSDVIERLLEGNRET